MWAYILISKGTHGVVIFKGGTIFTITKRWPHIIIPIKWVYIVNPMNYGPHVLVFKGRYCVIISQVGSIYNNNIVPQITKGGSYIVYLIILLLPFFGAKLS